MVNTLNPKRLQGGCISGDMSKIIFWDKCDFEAHFLKNFHLFERYNRTSILVGLRSHRVDNQNAFCHPAISLQKWLDRIWTVVF